MQISRQINYDLMPKEKSIELIDSLMDSISSQLINLPVDLDLLWDETPYGGPVFYKVTFLCDSMLRVYELLQDYQINKYWKDDPSRLEKDELPAWLEKHGLPLYGAALSKNARDLRGLDLGRAAVAVGSEGRGLSPELLALCRGEVIIPMDARSESLNAAVAAAVLMWEMARER